MIAFVSRYLVYRILIGHIETNFLLDFFKVSKFKLACIMRLTSYIRLNAYKLIKEKTKVLEHLLITIVFNYDSFNEII